MRWIRPRLRGDVIPSLYGTSACIGPSGMELFVFGGSDGIGRSNHVHVLKFEARLHLSKPFSQIVLIFPQPTCLSHRGTQLPLPPVAHSRNPEPTMQHACAGITCGFTVGSYKTLFRLCAHFLSPPPPHRWDDTRHLDDLWALNLRLPAFFLCVLISFHQCLWRGHSTPCLVPSFPRRYPVHRLSFSLPPQHALFLFFQLFRRAAAWSFRCASLRQTSPQVRHPPPPRRGRRAASAQPRPCARVQRRYHSHWETVVTSTRIP